MTSTTRIITATALVVLPSIATAAERACTDAEETALKSDFGSNEAGERAGLDSVLDVASGMSSNPIYDCATDGDVYAYIVALPLVGSYAAIDCNDDAGCAVSAIQSGNDLDVYVDGELLYTLSSSTPLQLFVEGSQGSDAIYVDTTYRAMVAGEAGSDIIITGMADDYVAAGNDDDFVVNRGGEDSVGLGYGDDLFVGSSDAEYVNGYDGDDIILLNGGDDAADGQDGEDIIRGGEGDDDLTGGADNDLIYGNEGDDFIQGGDEHDDVFGGAGADILEGNGGWDLIFGEDGNDYISGSDGSDYIDGGDGDDDIYGGAEGDIVVGGSGDDVLRGNGGDDVLWGGAGTDSVKGGNANDKCAGDTRKGCEDGLSQSQKDDLYAASNEVYALSYVPDIVLDELEHQWAVFEENTTDDWPDAVVDLAGAGWSELTNEFGDEVGTAWGGMTSATEATLDGISWLTDWIGSWF